MTSCREDEVITAPTFTANPTFAFMPSGRLEDFCFHLFFSSFLITFDFLDVYKRQELLKELEYLRAENAYLKKLQALVEERIVRESVKEPKPSKD